MIQGKTKRLEFPGHSGGSHTRTIVITFRQEVKRILGLSINGWDLQFDGKNDHEFGRARVNIADTSFSHSGNTVTGPVAILLRDWSGNADDRYSGSVDVMCLVETVD